MQDILKFFYEIIIRPATSFLQLSRKWRRWRYKTNMAKIKTEVARIIRRASRNEKVKTELEMIIPNSIYRHLQNLLIDKNKEQKSIVNQIYGKKKKQLNRALMLVCASIFLYYCINIIFHTNIKIEVITFLIILFGLIIMSRLLVSYRVRKGYYGMNYEECKELIYYLIENNDKNDINKGKKIFNEIEDCTKVGQEATAVSEL